MQSLKHNVNISTSGKSPATFYVLNNFIKFKRCEAMMEAGSVPTPYIFFSGSLQNKNKVSYSHSQNY